jgi:hypothetical protein
VVVGIGVVVLPPGTHRLSSVLQTRPGGQDGVGVAVAGMQWPISGIQ